MTQVRQSLPVPLREGAGRRGPSGWHRPLPPTPSRKGRGRFAPMTPRLLIKFASVATFLLAWHLATTTGAISPHLPPLARADPRPGTGPDRQRRAVEVGADLLGARLRRLRARRSRGGAARRGDGGVVAGEGHRRSVHLAAAPAAVDHLDSADHPLARHRRAAEGGDRLSRLLDLHPVLYARRSAARRSAAGARRAQSWRRRRRGDVAGDPARRTARHHRRA